ncbi:MAG TPA: M20/M25/M40 family metallo-hydrolase [Archaeoglobaceae archaeon]|nr:M20/M25/M40 family metallo-hydrolase [Archaeoglobaceae archaeon]
MMIVELLGKLVTIESLSRREDRLVAFLVDFLKNEGLKAVIQEGEVKNLIVNPDADLWMVTHMDTVRIKRNYFFDGKFAYGTGVCDPKGSIVSILNAVKRIKKFNLGLAFLSDEEESGKGSEILINEYIPKKTIVMEPTSLRIANKNYGCFEIEVDVKGFSVHASIPEEGDNAIEKTFGLINELAKTGIKFSVLEIKGGSDEYTIPDRCKVRFDFIFPPDKSVKELKEIVLPIAEKYGEFRVLEEYDGFLTEDFSVLEESIIKAGLEVKYAEMPSWTDAIHLRRAGSDVVVWGPGELKYCHTFNERIEVREIEKASEVIVNLNDIV